LFYQSNKKINKSLSYCLILSLFFDVGVFGKFFLIQPIDYNLGSAFWISTKTFFILLLSLATFRLKPINNYISDYILLAFFIWIIILLTIIPSSNYLYGIFSWYELGFAYYLLRSNLEIKDIKVIAKIFISMLIFQLIISSLQVIKGEPIGLLTESSVFSSPYGRSTPETAELFRVSGTFLHPNNFAAFLLFSLPFIFFVIKNSIFRNVLIFSTLLMIFFTYSRAAWLICGLFYVLFILIKIKKTGFPSINMNNQKMILVLISLIIIYYLGIPTKLLFRINSSINSFRPGSSFDLRLKLTDETIRILKNYPITGVGINQSVVTYISDPIYSIYPSFKDKYYRIHNSFLEIAAETGIIGLVLFFLFLSFSIKDGLYNKNDFQKTAIISLFGQLAIASFNPFFYSSQFSYFFLLPALILIN
jgi:O-antigen ligase